MRKIIVEPMLFYKFHSRDFNHITFSYEDCKLESIALDNNPTLDGPMNGYPIIIKHNNKFVMYYRTGTYDVLKNSDNNILRENQNLSIAYSDDGLTFNRPILDKQWGFNIIKKDYFCHNFFPLYDNKLNKYLAISGTKFDTEYIYLFDSDDGINWEQKYKIIDETMILSDKGHANHFDSLNSLFYNKLDQHYYVYLRNNHYEEPIRRLQYTKSKDLINWENCKPINVNLFPDNIPYTKWIYNAAITYYLNTNYYISYFSSSLINSTTKKCVNLMISNDGINWQVIEENIFKNLNHSMCVTGLFENSDKTKILIYAHNNQYYFDTNILCYSYQMNRISSLNNYLDGKEGTFKTNLINLINFNFFLNYKIINNGYIQLYLCDENDIVINDSKLNDGDSLNKLIIWSYNDILLDKNKKYYINFIVLDAYIYSYSYESV